MPISSLYTYTLSLLTSHHLTSKEGVPVFNAVREPSITGRRLDEFTLRLLGLRGYSIITTTEREYVTRMKENLCYVSLDFELELKVRMNHS